MLGKSRKCVDKNAWNSLDMDRTPDGAETLAAGLKRVKSFLDEIHSKDGQKTVLVVTHNFISKCIWILENNIQSKELINYLMKDYETDPSSIWKSEIFGRSLDVIVKEGIQAKLSMMPENARYKLQQTLSKLVNKGSGNLFAIVI